MKKWRMLLLALLLALLCGCAASEPLPDYAPEESQRLILYTSHKKEVWQPIVKEFEARTGVWVTVVEGGSNELLEQLIGASLDHRDPYAGPCLKFLDDRLPDLFFM